MLCRIVYKPDKTVSVIHYTPGCSKRTYEQAMEKAMMQELNGLPYEDIDTSELPQSREFRNAWEGEKGKKITISEVKKQNIIAEKNRPKLEDRIKALEDKLK